MVRTVAFYTSNPGKVEEVRTLLSPLGYRVVWRKGALLEPQVDTLEEVAVCKLADIPEKATFAMVEDSGIFIDSLGGFPGVYSAYVLRTVGLDGILRLVKGKPRDAEFRAVVAFRHEGKVKLFSGRVRGALSRSARGTHGFGYDPIFLPHGSQRTTAEMEPEEKNAVSHRGKAVRQLAAWLRKQTPD